MKPKRILLYLLILVMILPPFSMAQTKDAPKVYRIAIFPFMIYSHEDLGYLREGIYDILSSRITVEDGIVVIERSLVEQALYQERPSRLDETAAKRIGRRVKADYVIVGSLTKIGDYISLDARLISITEDKPPLTAYTQHKGIDDAMTKIGTFAQDIALKILGRRALAGRTAEPQHPYLSQPRDIGRFDREARGLKKSQTFDFEVKGLDIGDVDGDKKNELVIMDEHNLYIFKYDGEKLVLFQKIEAGHEHNFLTLDVADVNRNGYAEIIVTSVVEDNLRSFILEYEEKGFKKITEEAGWYFRVLEHPKEGLLLMGQQMGSDGVFVDPIYRMVWKKKSFEKGPKMSFPKETKLFGLALATDIRSKGSVDPVIMDEFDRLRILSPNGGYFWSSSDYFGGTNNFYETKKKKDIAFRGGEAPPWRVYIPQRIIVRDLDGDGLKEVVVCKNISSSPGFFGRLKRFEKAEVYNLVWEDNSFITNWKTREINGYIADFQIRDVDNDGQDELVIGVINPGSITERKYTSTILFLKLY